MTGVFDPDNVGHLAVCWLSFLAAAYYLSHYGREVRHWRRHYRRGVKALTGKHLHLQRWTLRLSMICGLTMTFSPIPLYIIHGIAAALHVIET